LNLPALRMFKRQVYLKFTQQQSAPEGCSMHVENSVSTSLDALCPVVKRIRVGQSTEKSTNLLNAGRTIFNRCQTLCLLIFSAA
jgi:hypothetical protein